MARMAYLYGSMLTEDLPDDWYSEAFGKLNRLSLYADRRVAVAASDAYSAAWNWARTEGFSRMRPWVKLVPRSESGGVQQGLGRVPGRRKRIRFTHERGTLDTGRGDLTLPPPVPAHPMALRGTIRTR